MNEARFSRDRRDFGPLFRAYDALLPLGAAALWTGALFNRKLRKALRGRLGRDGGWVIGDPDERPGLLFHAASYGEFEAVRPLLSALRALPVRIAVSYSSPSALPAVKGTDGLWAHGYLPLDFLLNHLKLLRALDVGLLLVAKHDLWPNLLRAAAMAGVKTGYINASLTASRLRLLPLVKPFHRRFIGLLDYIWAVSAEDADRLSHFAKASAEVSVLGDTRYDRVLQRAEAGRERYRDLRDSLGEGPVFIAGSTWPPDENLVWQAFTAARAQSACTKLLIAPHEPAPAAINRLRRGAETSGLGLQLLSDWSPGKPAADVTVVDKVGILAELYAAGDAAHVGGGFGRGVHSVIEPAALGIPVTFGPRHAMSHEAGLLRMAGGGFVVGGGEDLRRLWMEWTRNPSRCRQAGETAGGVVRAHAGATQRLIDRLKPMLTSA